MGWREFEFRLLGFMLFNQLLASFILYFRANIGGLHLFKTDSIISVTDKLFVIIICGTLLLHHNTRNIFMIEWFVYAQTVAYVITAVIAFSILFHRSGPVHFIFDPTYFKSLFRQTLPFALLTLLMAAYSRADTVFLDRLLVSGKEQAGIYAQSYRIIEILSNYGYLFTVILLPIFSRMVKQNEPVNDLLRLSFTLLFIPAIIVAVGCLVFRNEIMNFLYHETEYYSGTVFGILIFSFLGTCTTYIFGTLLTANNNLRQLNIMAGTAVAINIILNLILIRRFGVIGAAVSNASTQIITSVWQVLLVRRKFRTTFSWIYFFRLLIFVALVFLTGFLIGSLNIKILFAASLYTIISLILAIAIRLLKIRPFAAMIFTLYS